MFTKLFFTSLWLAAASLATAQTNYDLQGRLYSKPTKESIDIQYVDINNKFLLTEIRKFIKVQQDSSEVFKTGFGFIKISDLKSFPYKARILNSADNFIKDTVYQFFISTNSYLLSSYFSKTASYCQSCFPAYYSFVDGRLILFEDITTDWLTGSVYSEKSKQKVVDLVKKCLLAALKPNFTFYSFPDRKPYLLPIEKRKSISEQEIIENAWFVLNAGKKVTLHFDGSVTYSY